jgi:selenocysteine-specific elongation factor
MRVIGTAGHVDHGKSTLVQALTGIHPDRLKEEREREMTIDLGFAWLVLPPPPGAALQGSSPVGEDVGIIDVPGHRDFIENMLAGVGGIDAALFVVAADEGVMPQTREHLAILDILQIQGGVVALTKIDLLDDPEWLDLVENDLQSVLAGTVLETAPIVRVSSTTKQGIPELLEALRDCLSARPMRSDLNRPRLPVDRVFTMPGFGTVVTGTLVDGSFRTGDEVEILPQELRSRIRGLQTHKQKEQVAVPGSRTAINISGIALEQISRGNVVAHPHDYTTSQRLDASFRLLPASNLPLRHNTEVKLFINTSEVVARLRLLGAEQLLPGEEGWLQLETAEPVVCVRGDRYILRRPSPGETLGGGKIVDPHPRRRHRRFSSEVLASLEALSQGTPEDILLQALITLGSVPLKDLVSRSNLPPQVASQALAGLAEAGLLLNLDHPSLSSEMNLQSDDLVISRTLMEQITTRVLAELAAYHQRFPLRLGLPREELKSRLKDLLRPSPRLFNAALPRLVEGGSVKESGALLFLPGHSLRFTPTQQAQVDRLMSRFTAAPYAPPPLKECQAEVGEEVVAALLDLGQLVAIPPDLLFRAEDYQRMLTELRGLFAQQGTLTVAQVRDHFNTSRRYVLAWLEYLDSQGVTVRAGDTRRLKG